MISFGELFFCEKVILNRDGSPREFINRFTSMQADSYPFLFGFSIVTTLVYDNALYKWLSIRIRWSDGRIIFEGARQHIESHKYLHPNTETKMISTFENVKFTKPGDYTTYILVNDAVMHQDVLSFT